MANIATSTFIGRSSLGTGVPEAMSIGTTKGMLDLAGSNTGDQTLSRYLLGLKLTNGTAASTFISLPDSMSNNEGSLTLPSSTDSTVVLNSNTAGSTNITFKEGAGIELTKSGSTMTVSATPSVLPYTSFTALLTGVSVDDTLYVATELYNNTRGTFTITRTGEGEYEVEVTGITFPIGFTYVTIGNGRLDPDMYALTAVRASNSVISIKASSTLDTPTYKDINSTLIPFEIRIYTAL